MTSSRLFSLTRSSPKRGSETSPRCTAGTAAATGGEADGDAANGGAGDGGGRSGGRSGLRGTGCRQLARLVDLPLRRERLGLVVIDSVDQAAEHVLVLLLHEIAHDRDEVLRLGDVPVEDLLAGEDVPAGEEVRHDLRVREPRVLRLDVEGLPAVLHVVIEARDH